MVAGRFCSMARQWAPEDGSGVRLARRLFVDDSGRAPLAHYHQKALGDTSSTRRSDCCRPVKANLLACWRLRIALQNAARASE